MTSAHPVVLASVLLLLLNDHVLKHVWPGFVTGKLSDVVGPVVVAALLGDLLRRRERYGWWATAAAFAAVKTFGLPGAVGLSVARDPWDLLGLLALPVAWRLTRHRANPGRAVRYAATGLALLAATATSIVSYPRADLLVVRGGTVLTWVEGEAYASNDGGRTWAAETAPLPTTTYVDPRAAMGRTVCHDAHCYRLAARDAVDESTDRGVTWHPSWRTPGRDINGRQARTPGLIPFTHEDDYGQSGARDVVFAPGTDVVVVAFGREGVLRREGTGPWQRIAVGNATPPHPRGKFWTWLVPLGLLFAATALAVFLAVLSGRTIRASPPARSEAAAVWYPTPPRTRSSPRRSPRHLR